MKLVDLVELAFVLSKACHYHRIFDSECIAPIRRGISLHSDPGMMPELTTDVLAASDIVPAARRGLMRKAKARVSGKPQS